MKRFLLPAIALLFSVYAWAGSVVKYRVINNTETWAVLPNCRTNSTDTCGVIPLANAKYFSIEIRNGSIGAKKDTAIVDSGFFVRLYSSYSNSTTGMSVLTGADSSIQFFGDDTLNQRRNRTKGLTLDAVPYLGITVRRYDTNGDTLDYKTNAGVRDSSLFLIHLIK